MCSLFLIRGQVPVIIVVFHVMRTHARGSAHIARRTGGRANEERAAGGPGPLQLNNPRPLLLPLTRLTAEKLPLIEHSVLAGEAEEIATVLAKHRLTYKAWIGR